MIPSTTLLSGLPRLDMPAAQSANVQVATFPPGAPMPFADKANTSPYLMTTRPMKMHATKRPVLRQRAAASFPSTTTSLLDDARGRTAGQALFLTRPVRAGQVVDGRHILSENIPVTASRLKRSRSDSPPPPPRSQLNSVAFPTSDAEPSSPSSGPERKRGRSGSLSSLQAIGEDEEEDDDEPENYPESQRRRERLLSHSFVAPARTQTQRKSRRQRLYARKFPARSFIPRLDSITEMDVDLEDLAFATDGLPLSDDISLDSVEGVKPVSEVALDVAVVDCAVHTPRRMLKPLRTALHILRRTSVLLL
ncbi:hypothetical protein EXIGLDRAFT_841233 [Exidia glandulosa HHB12029]|uniref:Uncharacterized protein n=1 Tax=Exidia glandulosa HHB12029 TaxID=1314781 RepID=A0A165E018_EXIGL|nr:hypothetical protein EXIGLDRAFT_841233 [Exidia glandulosa HHB12029]